MENIKQFIDDNIHDDIMIDKVKNTLIQYEIEFKDDMIYWYLKMIECEIILNNFESVYNLIEKLIKLYSIDKERYVEYTYQLNNIISVFLNLISTIDDNISNKMNELISLNDQLLFDSIIKLIDKYKLEEDMFIKNDIKQLITDLLFKYKQIMINKSDTDKFLPNEESTEIFCNYVFKELN